VGKGYNYFEGAGRVIAGAERSLRKVRTPKGRELGNSQAGKPDGKCNREQTANSLRAGALVRVKGWCKRPPAQPATVVAR